MADKTLTVIWLAVSLASPSPLSKTVASTSSRTPFVWAAEKQHLIQPSSFQFTFGHGGKASLNIGLFNSFKHSSLISWADKNSDKTFWRTSVELNKKQDSKRYRLNDCILGTPLMELGSVIFNFDLRRMGFAKAR